MILWLYLDYGTIVFVAIEALYSTRCAPDANERAPTADGKQTCMTSGLCLRGHAGFSIRNSPKGSM